MSDGRRIRPGVALAIDPKAVKQGPDSLILMMGPPVAPNERYGDVAVVHIRGSLEHHDDGMGDSYELIRARVSEALAPCDEGAQPPKALVLCLDSPGGVVSGLNETVAWIRRTAAGAGVRTYAHVNELAASAAFALASSCDEIYLPRSGILGSVGVISTMFSQARHDAKQGFDYVTITSGDRKADGHVHQPIGADAIAAEQKRVERLAKQFFRMVSKSRGLSVAQLRSYQAGLFVGPEAVRADLADGVLGLEELLSTIAQDSGNRKKPAQTGTNGTSKSKSTAGANMTAKLSALIASTEAAIASEKDPTKLSALADQLAAYKKTKKSVEETEESDAGEEEEEKGNETKRRSDDDDDDDGDDDDDKGEDDAEEDEEDEEEEEEEAKKSEEEEDEAAKKAAASIVSASGLLGSRAKAARASIRGAIRNAVKSALNRRTEERTIAAAARKMTGKKTAGSVVATLQGRINGANEIKKRLAALEQDTRKRQRNALVDEALASRRITRHEAKTLRSKKIDFVRSFLEMRPSAIIHTDNEALLVPGSRGAGGELSAEVMRQIDVALQASDGAVTREQLVAAHKERSNGTGRY